MSLETFETPDSLYLARGDEVNPLRPLLTGDVVAGVGERAYGLMPLPDLLEAGKLWVARLDDIGRALTAQLAGGARVACLAPLGINLLQQRIIFRLTRHEVPTHQLQEVSATRCRTICETRSVGRP